jgi:hypothetical protein
VFRSLSGGCRYSHWPQFASICVLLPNFGQEIYFIGMGLLAQRSRVSDAKAIDVRRAIMLANFIEERVDRCDTYDRITGVDDVSGGFSASQN